MTDPLALQHLFQKRNAETRTHWDEFRSHRERLTTLLVANRPSASQSLCVLGAGNCNDLDLPRLLAAFSEITLVDIDLAAMQEGLARQGTGDSFDRLVLVEADVTGTHRTLERFAARSGGLQETDIQAVLSQLQELPLIAQLSRQFDCVVSVCLLSQLIDGVRRVVGEAPDRFVPLVQAIRRQHLATLLRLTAPGGKGILVFDFVSSLTCPELLTVADEELPQLAERLVSQGNFFTGLRPSIVANDFRAQLVSLNEGNQPEIVDPWRWNLGPRTYMVQAVMASLG